MSKIEQGGFNPSTREGAGEEVKIEKPQEIFIGKKEKIEKELKRSPENGWLNCLNTQIATAVFNVGTLGEKGALEKGEKDFALKQLGILQNQSEALMEIYPGIESNNAPEWIKETFLNLLTYENIFVKKGKKSKQEDKKGEQDKEYKQDENYAEKIRNDVLTRLGKCKKNDSNSADGRFKDFRFALLGIFRDLEKPATRRKSNLSDEEYDKLKNDVGGLLKRIEGLIPENGAIY